MVMVNQPSSETKYHVLLVHQIGHFGGADNLDIDEQIFFGQATLLE